jgi:parallel beta-helix repeat protein
LALGILLYEASYNNIISNHVYFINSSYDEVWGICLRNYCNHNNIISNYVYNLSTPDWVAYGIHLWHFSNNNNISFNHVMNLTYNRKNIGIRSSTSSNNNIIENDVHNLFATGTSSGQAFGIQVTTVLHYFDNVISNRVHDIHALYGQSMGIYYGSVACSNISSNLVYNISSIDEYAVGIRTIGPADYNNITFNSIWNIKSTNHKAYGIQNQRLPIRYYNISSNKILNISGGQEAYGIFLEEDCDYHNLTSNYINNISSPTGIAYGMDFRDASYNTIDNCTINDTKGGVHFDGQSVDNIFINCSISNTETYDFHFDSVAGGDSHATTLNTTFNKTRVYYADTLSNLTVKWFMHVKVIYLNGTPVSNAYIWVNDSNGAPVFKDQADTDGWVKWLTVTEYIEQDTNKDHIGERIYFTPHKATASDGKLWGFAYPDPFMDESKTIIIILGDYSFINLQPGWNLISLPRIQLDTDLQTILQSIEGDYDAVQWYDIVDNDGHWKHYHISKPIELNDLEEINHSMGFWIHVTNPNGATLIVQGEVFSFPQNITLFPGWNQVGYPSTTNKSRDMALNNINFGSETDSIWTHNATTKKWKEIGPTDYFEPGRGYWIHSMVRKTWVVPI